MSSGHSSAPCTLSVALLASLWSTADRGLAGGTPMMSTSQWQPALTDLYIFSVSVDSGDVAKVAPRTSVLLSLYIFSVSVDC